MYSLCEIKAKDKSTHLQAGDDDVGWVDTDWDGGGV
jgi:hypothetical protein